MGKTKLKEGGDMQAIATLRLRFEIWRLERRRARCVRDLNKLFGECQRFELVPGMRDTENFGLLPSGFTQSLVELANEFTKDTGVVFSNPPLPRFHPWERLIVHPSRIRLAFAKELEELQKTYRELLQNSLMVLVCTKLALSMLKPKGQS